MALSVMVISDPRRDFNRELSNSIAKIRKEENGMSKVQDELTISTS